MTRGILLAWLVGIGVITWRGVAKYHKPVSPGQYMAASGVYVLLAVVAEWQPAATVATLMAWGFDLAVILQLTPEQVSGPKKTAAPAAGEGTSGNARQIIAQQQGGGRQ